MKNHFKPIDRVEFTIDTPELPDFTITGDYETLQPVYQQYEQQFKRDNRKAGKQAVTAAQVVIEPVATIGRRAVESLEVRAYDMVNGTNFRDILKEQRRIRRNEAFARKLGLIAI